jgi:hypothetical protein
LRLIEQGPGDHGVFLWPQTLNPSCQRVMPVFRAKPDAMRKPRNVLKSSLPPRFFMSADLTYLKIHFAQAVIDGSWQPSTHF